MVNWLDQTGNEKIDEYKTVDALPFHLEYEKIISAEAAAFTVTWKENRINMLFLELRIKADDLFQIATVGLWGLNAEFVRQFDPVLQPALQLQMRPELLECYRNQLQSMTDIGSCLTVIEREGQFPVLLKLNNYELIRIDQ
jgi:hypothetical protein